MSLIVLPRQQLKQIVSQLTGLDCYYSEEPIAVASDISQAQAKLKISALRRNGVDEFRYTDGTTNNPGTYTEAIEGYRGFTLTVLVECYAQSMSLAPDYLETLRTRLQRDSQRVKLHALNMAVETLEPIQDHPTSYDQRVISAATLDIHLAWAFEDVTDGPGPLGPQQGWIAEVNGSTQAPGTAPTVTGTLNQP